MNSAVTLSLSSGKIGEQLGMVLASVKPPVGTEPIPHDICCVVDISGSMGSAAPSATNDPETQGFSVLDIVKHAIKTIVHLLQPTDRLALVT